MISQPCHDEHAMVDSFTVERFVPHIGEVFTVLLVAEAREVKLLLTEISALPSDGDRRRQRQPFALVFHAPRGTTIPARIHPLQAAGIEPFDCFLEAIGPDENGMRYEAVFG